MQQPTRSRTRPGKSRVRVAGALRDGGPLPNLTGWITAEGDSCATHHPSFPCSAWILNSTDTILNAAWVELCFRGFDNTIDDWFLHLRVLELGEADGGKEELQNGWSSVKTQSLRWHEASPTRGSFTGGMIMYNCMRHSVCTR